METFAGYLPFLLFLVCPLSMAVGMWLMGRAMRLHQMPPVRPADEAARIGVLEADNALLKEMVRHLTRPAGSEADTPDEGARVLE